MANVLTAVPLGRATLHGNEQIQTPIGRIELAHTYFDDDASERLFDEMDYQRVTQAYIWSTPLVSMTTWRDRQGLAYGVSADTDFVVLESLNDKRGLVTSDLTTPSLVNFISLKSGPLEIVYPSGQTVGTVYDFWQRPLCKLGVTGPDAGRGGRYVIVGPGDDTVKDRQQGTYVSQSVTNNICISLNISEKDADDFETFTAAYRMGRGEQALAPSRFRRGKNVEWSATAPRGLDYWRTLAAIVNEEPGRAVDAPWIAMLRPLGIMKGRPFDPDRRQQEILLKGAAMGELMTRNLQVNPRDQRSYWPGTYWFESSDFHIGQEIEYRAAHTENAPWCYEAVQGAHTALKSTRGQGLVCVTTKRDSRGRMLRSDRSYTLHVPTGPVGLFWGLTLYSENTRRPYENGGTEIRSVHVESTMRDLTRNDDGSVDLYIGAEAPAGFENNFLKTVGDDGWFVYLRLNPLQHTSLVKTFALGDFERLDRNAGSRR